MEYGLIPNIDQYRDNKSLEIKKVQNTKETSILEEHNKSLEVDSEDLLNDIKISQLDEVKNETNNLPKYEVVLTNMNFGFNNSSQDFYVKAIRGNTENQYPTEDMMKLKSYLMNLEDSA